MNPLHPDPSRGQLALNAQEIGKMRADIGSVRDRGAAATISWLLDRTLITIEQYQAQLRQVKARLSEASLDSKRFGAATTLSPRDAVRYLSPAELAELVDPAAAQAIQRAELAAAAADASRKELLQRASDLTLAVEGLRGVIADEHLATLEEALRGVAQVAPAATSGSWVSGPVQEPEDSATGLDDLFS